MQRILRLAGKMNASFRRWPHWAQDMYGIVSYLNFIELIPTLAVMALRPRHFFRRLPLTLAHKRRMFQTPVKFFMNFASLFLLVFYLRHGDLESVVQQARALWYMPLLIPATPILMAGLAIGCWVLYQLPQLIPSGQPFPQPNPYPFRLVVAPSSWLQLNPFRFTWGLFYISVYFVASWQLVQLAIGYDFLATVAVVNQLGDGHVAVRAIVLILAVVLVAGLIHWLVFRPYGEMFRMSLRRPTTTVYQADVYDVRTAVTDLLKAAGHGHVELSEFESMLAILEAELGFLANCIRLQDHDYRLTVVDCQRRAAILARAFRTDQLREVLAAKKDVSHEERARFANVLDTMDRLQMTEGSNRAAA